MRRGFCLFLWLKNGWTSARGGLSRARRNMGCLQLVTHAPCSLDFLPPPRPYAATRSGLAPRHLEPIMPMSLLASERVDSTVTAEPAAIVPVNPSARLSTFTEKKSLNRRGPSVYPSPAPAAAPRAVANARAPGPGARSALAAPAGDTGVYSALSRGFCRVGALVPRGL